MFAVPSWDGEDELQDDMARRLFKKLSPKTEHDDDDQQSGLIGEQKAKKSKKKREKKGSNANPLKETKDEIEESKDRDNCAITISGIMNEGKVSKKKVNQKRKKINQEDNEHEEMTLCKQEVKKKTKNKDVKKQSPAINESFNDAENENIQDTGLMDDKADKVDEDKAERKQKRKLELQESEDENRETRKKRKTKKKKKDVKMKSTKINEPPLMDTGPSSCHSIESPSHPKSKHLESAENIIEKVSNDKKSKTSSDILKNKLKKKLAGAQFRWINEQLYTVKSGKAWKMFRDDPTLFDVYHHGFQSQVESWPENPVDIFIQQLRKSPEDIVVADLGCGEAKIAQSVKQKVFSFDLIAKNDFVVAADISKVPLNAESVDMAIFCLSLMGVNVSDFMKEARRILKPNGVLKVAEVASRFEDLDDFVEKVCKMGFKLTDKDESNKMFVLMDFVKTKERKESDSAIKLKPCIYKRR